MAKWMDTLEVVKGAAYYIETVDMGGSVVPEEVCGRAPGTTEQQQDLPATWEEGEAGFDDVVAHLRDYFQGKRVVSVTRKHGYCWRLTEPGYLDCTEWSFAESEDEVEADAKEIYDHEEE